MENFINTSRTSQRQNKQVLNFCFLIIIIATALLLSGCQKETALTTKQQAKLLTKQFADQIPTQWSETLPGTMRYLDLPVSQNKVCLTLDACGSKNDSYDKKLITFLIAEKIPASLFINSRWIDKNLKTFKTLADNPLFDIQNHGQNHLPASVNGRSIYNIAGTADVNSLVQEVGQARDKIKHLTKIETTYFRSGTAYYDEIAIKVIQKMGQKIAGFSVLGDAGCTYSAEQVEQAVLLAQPCDIIIAHMNHPEKQTAEGIMPALKKLKERGYNFVTLRNSPTRHTPPTGYKPTSRDPAIDINTISK